MVLFNNMLLIEKLIKNNTVKIGNVIIRGLKIGKVKTRLNFERLGLPLLYCFFKTLFLSTCAKDSNIIMFPKNKAKFIPIGIKITTI
jgi:hypothetical protein